MPPSTSPAAADFAGPSAFSMVTLVYCWANSSGVIFSLNRRAVAFGVSDALLPSTSAVPPVRMTKLLDPVFMTA